MNCFTKYSLSAKTNLPKQDFSNLIPNPVRQPGISQGLQWGLLLLDQQLWLKVGVGKIGVIVKGHQVGAGPWICLNAVNGATRLVVHEVETQLSRGASPAAEILYPLLDLHTIAAD